MHCPQGRLNGFAPANDRNAENTGRRFGAPGAAGQASNGEVQGIRTSSACDGASPASRADLTASTAPRHALGIAVTSWRLHLLPGGWPPIPPTGPTTTGVRKPNILTNIGPSRLNP